MLARVHDDVAVDQHVLHVGGGARVDQPRDRIAGRLGVKAVEPDDREVGALANLDRADAIVQAEHARTVDRQHRERVHGGERRGVLLHDLRQERGLAKLGERVHPVVAGSAVCTEPDDHPGGAHRHDVRDPAGELQVRARAVDEARAALAGGLHLRRGQLDAVREHRARPRDAEGGQDVDVVLTEDLTYLVPLARVLGRVRVHDHLGVRRELRRRAQELLGAAQDEARSEGVPEPTRGSVPARQERRALVQAVLAALAQALRQAAARVHHRLAREPADAAVAHRLEHGVLAADRAHVEDGRGAGAHHLGQAEARAGAERRVVVRSLERPDPLPQPVHERKVVCHAAKERLAQVNVRLDEARHDGASARVEHPRGGPLRQLAHVGDAAVDDEHVAVDHAARAVHRHDRAARDDQRQPFAHSPSDFLRASSTVGSMASPACCCFARSVPVPAATLSATPTTNASRSGRVPSSA